MERMKEESDAGGRPGTAASPKARVGFEKQDTADRVFIRQSTVQRLTHTNSHLVAFYWLLKEACDAADAARRMRMGGASVVFWSPGSSTER
jgi:hypothetical protein